PTAVEALGTDVPPRCFGAIRTAIEPAVDAFAPVIEAVVDPITAIVEPLVNAIAAKVQPLFDPVSLVSHRRTT
ncbi:MAG: hypothetical protein L0Y45_08045, partial [Woeseiaceae bacterium]|nr:hypothetical protein [Woeseiaceae bacterium]